MLSLSLKNGIIFALVIIIAHVSLVRTLAARQGDVDGFEEEQAPKAPSPATTVNNNDNDLQNAPSSSPSPANDTAKPSKKDDKSSKAADLELQKYVFGQSFSDKNAPTATGKTVESYTGTLTDATADTSGHMLLQKDAPKTSSDDLPGFETSGMFTML